MPLPNFLIIAPSKSGTSSLYKHLKAHPQIFMSPIKETHFFSKDLKEIWGDKTENYPSGDDLKDYFDGSMKKEYSCVRITKWDQYKRLFKNVKDEIAIGEASPTYIRSNVAAKEIYNTLPDVKIIIMLRNPIKRAFSHYLMDLRVNYIKMNESFLQALKKRKEYVEIGKYYNKVKKYLDLFPKENIQLYLADDFRNHPSEVLLNIFRFLNVRPKIYTRTLNKYNVAQVPRLAFVNFILNDIPSLDLLLKRILIVKLPVRMKEIIKKIIYTSKDVPRISDHEKLFLQRIFQKDIKKLSNLIDRDLSIWLQ